MPDVIITDNRSEEDDPPEWGSGKVKPPLVKGDIVAFELKGARVFLVLDTGYQVSIALDAKFGEVISKIVAEEAIKRLQE